MVQSHSGIPHIKLFITFFNFNKRPSMVPNYIIPSEYEMLEVLSRYEGVVTWDLNAKTIYS
jgi:hypothetical protein